MLSQLTLAPRLKLYPCEIAIGPTYGISMHDDDVRTRYMRKVYQFPIARFELWIPAIK